MNNIRKLSSAAYAALVGITAVGTAGLITWPIPEPWARPAFITIAVAIGVLGAIYGMRYLGEDD